MTEDCLGVLKELNSCFKNFKTFICETLEDQTSHHEPVINTFLEFAYQWSWFYLNLSCLSKALSIKVLHKELKMDFHLTVLYQMVGLISQIVASRQKSIEDQEAYIKVQIVQALANLMRDDKAIFERIMFEHNLLQLLTDDI